MSYPKSPLHLSSFLNERTGKGLLRALRAVNPHIDFSSNDYLGFASRDILAGKLAEINSMFKTGSTGSRLISGHSQLFNEVETGIALFHHADAALLFNSGYDANVGLLSSVPQKNDLVLFDELIHASVYDGIRLNHARHYKFRHNDTGHLQELLTRHRSDFTNIYVVLESVYSMDGDFAPLKDIVAICQRFEAFLIVDEAHAIGVFGKKGRGLCEASDTEAACFARIYTYGKAMGCHGAAVVGGRLLREYLVNFARSFIYTTAMPEHNLCAIKAAYMLLENTEEIEKLQANIAYFNSHTQADPDFIASRSAIHCRVIPGNGAVQGTEDHLAGSGIFAKAIKSPTVKQGLERIRICLHAFNTREEIDMLLNGLKHVNFQ